MDEGLLERLKETMKNEFGITTPEQLDAAAENINLDIGVFTSQFTTEEEKHAS